MLGIFAGSDTVSASLVVGAFLAGLGLGAVLGARFADRLSPRAALAAYAMFEVLVGLLTLGSDIVLYDWLALGLAPRIDTPSAIFALCFLVLLPPTVLMGASMPLLARAVADGLDGLAGRIGTLYGLNTFGAGLGALLGGWVLVGMIGYVATLGIAAALNFLAAGLALTLLRGASPAPPAPAAQTASEPFGSLPIWCLLVFLSGYVGVALEIVWVRMMGQVGQFHAYLFATVLGVFLLADGLGMAVGARLVRRLRDPRPAFFAAQASGFVLAVLLLLGLWHGLPHVPLAEALSVDQSRLRGMPLLVFTAVTVLVVAPPSFLIGLTFPLVQQAVQRDLAAVGARVGWVQFANILGNAAGSIVTGLVTFHLVGTAGTLMLLAALSVILPLGWLWRARPAQRPLAIGLVALCAATLAVLPSNDVLWGRLHREGPDRPLLWAEDRSGVVAFRDDGPRATLPFLPPLGTGDAALDALVAATAASAATPSAGPAGPMFIQGFSQGRLPFLPLHQFIGAVGPLLHPEPRRVLIVGIGSGGTPWAAGISPRTQEIRAIEIVGPVLPVLRAIAQEDANGALARMLADPRWTLEIGDARRAMTRDPGGYDIIQADAIPPESSHSGLLYSAEFLAMVRRALAPGGLYVKWAPTRRTVETFATAFPHVLLLMPASVLIGSDRPISFDRAALAARFAAPEAAAHLALGNAAFQDYAAMFGGKVMVWTPETPRNPAEPPLTDGFPRDEFYLNNRLAPPQTASAPGR